MQHNQTKIEEIERQAYYKRELDNLVKQVIPKFERMKVMVKKLMSEMSRRSNSRKPTRSSSRLPSTPRSRRSPS